MKPDSSASAADTNTATLQAVTGFMTTTQQLLECAREHRHAADAWQQLEQFVDTQHFEWFGPFCERLDWPGYAAHLQQWGRFVRYTFKLIRMHQHFDRVYVEHDQNNLMDDTAEMSHSLSIFTLNDRNQIYCIEVYLRRPQSLGL